MYTLFPTCVDYRMVVAFCSGVVEIQGQPSNIDGRRIGDTWHDLPGDSRGAGGADGDRTGQCEGSAGQAHAPALARDSAGFDAQEELGGDHRAGHRRAIDAASHHLLCALRGQVRPAGQRGAGGDPSRPGRRDPRQCPADTRHATPCTPAAGRSSPTSRSCRTAAHRAIGRSIRCSRRRCRKC